MPSETTETLELPATPGDPTDRYALRRDRGAVEVSLRLVGVRLIRARLRARDGELVVTGGVPSAGSIRVDLLARPIRIAPAPLAVLLRGVRRRRRLTFTAVDVDLPTGAQRSYLDGEITVHGSSGQPWSLPLTIRVVPSEDATVLLAAQGPIRPQGTVTGRLAALGRLLWLDAAVEFSR